MKPRRRVFIAAALIFALAPMTACTDWSEALSEPGFAALAPGSGGGDPSSGGADATGTRVIHVDTWTPPRADVVGGRSGADAATADAAMGTDAPGGPDVAGGPDAAGGTDAAEDGSASADDAADAGAGPDVDLDTKPGSDALADGGAGADAVTDTGMGADAVADGGTGMDVIAETGGGVDAVVDSGLDTATAPDSGSDAGVDSGPALDSGMDAVVDTGPSPDGGADTFEDTGAVEDTGSVEDSGSVEDTGADVPPVDAGADSGDAVSGSDWQGFDDATFPDSGDIYGGAVASCTDLYLLTIESCGYNPTVACIDQAAAVGSQYANWLYEPLHACLVETCVPLCAGQTEGKCVEACLGKYCTNQFFSCISSGQSGKIDCAQTFGCFSQYEGKMLTIAALCYANATPSAQKALAGFVGCVSQPQTDSCMGEIAACYGSGNLSCAEVLQCTDGCSGDGNCGFDCIGQATPAAATKLDALADCMTANCSECNGNSTCEGQCIQQSCNTEFVDCFTDQ